MGRRGRGGGAGRGSPTARRMRARHVGTATRPNAEGKRQAPSRGCDGMFCAARRIESRDEVTPGQAAPDQPPRRRRQRAARAAGEPSSATHAIKSAHRDARQCARSVKLQPPAASQPPHAAFERVGSDKGPARARASGEGRTVRPHAACQCPPACASHPSPSPAHASRAFVTADARAREPAIGELEGVAGPAALSLLATVTVAPAALIATAKPPALAPASASPRSPPPPPPPTAAAACAAPPCLSLIHI